PGIIVTADKQAASDFVRDLDNSMVRDATGKLGSKGKHVEIAGHSATTGLDETLTLEVYDDFPELAVLSASYKNSVQKPVVLARVALQRHLLDASLTDTNSKPNEMWAFFGASLKWGKDDVLQIPANFNQENPFGAPTHDDSGTVGGGVPVAAFWTRNSGLA